MSYIVESDDQKHRYCYKGNAYSTMVLERKEVFIEIDSTDFFLTS